MSKRKLESDGSFNGTKKLKIKKEPLEDVEPYSEEPNTSSRVNKRQTKSKSVPKLKVKEEVQNTNSVWKESDLGTEINIKIETIPKKEEFVENIVPAWQDFELLSQETNISPDIAKSLIKLFDDGNTIPFINRYRRNIVGYMTPDTLRVIKDHYEDICCLKTKLKTVAKSIEKTGQLNHTIRKSLISVRTLEELEYVYAPFKQGGKRSLAERAKALGLENAAQNILHNTCKEDLQYYVESNKDGLKNIGDVEKGIIHIIASTIASDTEVLSFIRDLRTKHNFCIETKKASSKKETKSACDTKNVKKIIQEESKYSIYFDFQVWSNRIKPHQVLAINRGENQKVLSVRINVPDFIFNKFDEFCTHKFVKGQGSPERIRIMKEGIKDSYDRLLQPLLIREIRSSLKQMAEKVSMEQFSKNLKQLLLATPVKGKSILGLDPGFTNGCKLALISETGSLLDHNVIYPFKTFKGARDEAEYVLKHMLQSFNCELIAVGNGTACRETESWLSDIIGARVFQPLKVTYTIVCEDGASIYSCSNEAKKEFPNLDPHIISAARRIQEPLAELVKVEPQHLGVGMYQHDLRKKQLNEALNEVVSECVSFVGVDLNTASHCLLKSIAGLTEKRALQILQYREENGPFTYRKELLKIKGIGEKIFQQCAGFLRVVPINLDQESKFYKKSNTTKLDRTIVHPESYDVAKKLMTEFRLSENDIGNENFIKKINDIKLSSDLKTLSEEYETNEECLKLILDALSKPLNHDLRSEYNITPMFRKEVTNANDLKVGAVLSGRICNVTSFGCFVDIGVKINGLIHVSAMGGFQLQIGDRVEVEVLSLELERKRIGLKCVGIVLN